MRDTKADWEMIYYADSVHAFTDPEAGNDNSRSCLQCKSRQAFLGAYEFF
jgi:hypothetical protein